MVNGLLFSYPYQPDVDASEDSTIGTFQYNLQEYRKLTNPTESDASELKKTMLPLPGLFCLPCILFSTHCKSKSATNFITQPFRNLSRSPEISAHLKDDAHSVAAAKFSQQCLTTAGATVVLRQEPARAWLTSSKAQLLLNMESIFELVNFLGQQSLAFRGDQEPNLRQIQAVVKGESEFGTNVCGIVYDYWVRPSAKASFLPKIILNIPVALRAPSINQDQSSINTD